MEKASSQLDRKVEWLKNLFDLDSRDVEIFLDHTIGGTRLVVRDNGKEEDIFSCNGSDAIVLATLTEWTAELRIYVSVDQVFACHKKPNPTKGWKTVPKKVGIVWHDDPTYNEVLLGQPWRWNYTLDPIEDPVLFGEYLEDIVSLLL